MANPSVARRPGDSRSVRVFFTSPQWHLSGVNSVHAHLVNGLSRLGYDCAIILTRESAGRAADLARSTGLPIRSLRPEIDPANPSWPRIWAAATRLLVDAAPSVLVPGYDYETASIIPRLPSSVATIGVVHSDEPFYFNYAAHHLTAWDSLVGVSDFLTSALKRLHPSVADRIRHIPNGVAAPSNQIIRTKSTGPIRIIYSGRISQHQKRILDIPLLLDELHRGNVPFKLTVVGSGPEDDALRRSTLTHTQCGRVRFLGNLTHDDATEEFSRQDVILLLSEFEGLPMTILEAMARGCIPVVSDIRSGIPELVEHEVNGYRIPVGDVRGFAAALSLLSGDATLRRACSRSAMETFRKGPYSTNAMTLAYAQLIEEIQERNRQGRHPHRSGRLTPPAHLKTLPRLRARMSFWLFRSHRRKA